MAKSSPPTKTKAAEKIELMGFTYTDERVDLTELVDPQVKGVQVRETAHYAPKESVERYRVQLREDSEFEENFPIVISKDKRLLDGYTRKCASLANAAKMFHALVLDEEYETASEERKDDMLILASILNGKAGVGLTRKESLASARVMLRRGWTPARIGNEIGVDPSTLTGLRQEMTAKDRLEGFGLTVAINGKSRFRGASLRALGHTGVMTLNDAPYQELAELAGSAKLNAKEIDVVAKELRGLGSDSKALTKLNDLRQEMDSRIKENEQKGDISPPYARHLRTHLGFINNQVGKEEHLIERSSLFAQKHLAALKLARRVLSEVITMQESVMTPEEIGDGSYNATGEYVKS